MYALAALNRKLDALRAPPARPCRATASRTPPTPSGRRSSGTASGTSPSRSSATSGIAFAAVLVLIYVLVVGWFQSFTVPLGHPGADPALAHRHPARRTALLGAFFTATSMIGFIAGAGIIVRNSIILVDFIELKLREGMPLAAAVEEAGVVRFRPMLLTAAAVLVGSAVMLADPIFQGLAISLMAGEVAATLLSRLAVPVLYYLLARRGRAAELQREGARAQQSVPHELPRFAAIPGGLQ